jgi:hypothetical protein
MISENKEMSNYSIEILKKSAFVDEMNNVINGPLSAGIYGEETVKIVKDYLTRRLAEIIKEHG